MSNTPVRLHKKEELTLIEKIDEELLKRSHIFVPILLVILVMLFVMLCFAIVGASAVESGGYYYHLGDVI